MFDRILQYGFIFALVFMAYSAGVLVNMFNVWPNSIYMKMMPNVSDSNHSGEKGSKRKN